MINELIETVRQIRNGAQTKRRRARQTDTPPAERDRLLSESADEFGAAISRLERGLRTIRRSQPGHTVDVCRLLQALSQTHGSLGGTRRDARDYAAAIKQYTQGNVYEEERRTHCRGVVHQGENLGHDTYNMLQRLIAELLDDPKRLERPEFMAELHLVRDELEKEADEGRDDSWALADLALTLFLSGSEPDTVIANVTRHQRKPEEVVRSLEASQAQPSFYESTYFAVDSLINEGLGSDSPLGERLRGFRQLLQRKGGLA